MSINMTAMYITIGGGYTMSVVELVKENAIVLLLAFIALVVIIGLIKKVIKTMIFVLLVGIGVYYFMGLAPTDAENAGKAMLTQSEEETRDTAIQKLIGYGGSSGVTYSQTKDGFFVIERSTMVLKGKYGDKQYSLIIAGQTFKVDASDTLNKYVQTVKTTQESPK